MDQFSKDPNEMKQQLYFVSSQAVSYSSCFISFDSLKGLQYKVGNLSADITCHVCRQCIFIEDKDTLIKEVQRITLIHKSLICQYPNYKQGDTLEPLKF